MITTQDFMLSDTEEELFRTMAISTLNEIAFALELYKLRSREQIISVLIQDFPDIRDVSAINRAVEYVPTEEKYNVLIDRVSPKKVNVYVRAFSTCDKTSISLSLNDVDIEFYHVTVLNYCELLGEDVNMFYVEELLFKRIILEGLRLKATDLHFSVKHTKDGVSYPIYYRSGGQFSEMKLFKLNRSLNESMIRKFVEQKTNGVSLDLANSAGVITSVNSLFSTKPVELRISANSVIDGYRYVIRMQEQTTTSMKIDELGFDEKVLQFLHAMAGYRSGITFITGAMRTGKNTTAYGIANEMNNAEELSIISYDSPAEVLMAFPQVDYKEDPDRLLHCVRLAKKQDIDIAFLNEIPSKEVAFAVKDLVNSSVGVVTTLHLDRIWDLPYKLYEYYGESYKDIISQINGVINQKMFGVPCPYCQKTIKTFEIQNGLVRKYLEDREIENIFINTGCEKCINHETEKFGFIIGKNQPYAEFIVFTENLRDKLLKATTAWEMSAILRNTVTEQGNRLEDFMIPAIKEGRLSYQTLQYVL